MSEIIKTTKDSRRVWAEFTDAFEVPVRVEDSTTASLLAVSVMREPALLNRDEVRQLRDAFDAWLREDA